MTDRFIHPLPFGATRLDNGSTRFRLWAPSRTEARLLINDTPPQLMEGRPDGWFELMTDCKVGDLYRFQFEDEMKVPDPASRFQHGDVHGCSVILDPLAYQWKHPHWLGRPWEETILYELHVGACGGYGGVAAQLPALKALGITAIELMPINEFPGDRNWGYDGVLPFAPEAGYGTAEDLKSLIDTAHGLGLMMFLDVVYNHFGPDGAYLHTYARPFFQEDVHTPWGAAIDFARPEVRDYFTQNALYWLMEYRFDGLRFDAVHAITEKSWLFEVAARIRATVEPGRRVHLVLENEHNEPELLESAFNAQWNDDGHNVLHVLLTGEHETYYANYAENAAGKLARCLQDGFIYQGEPMRTKAGAPRGRPSGHLPPTAFVLFLQNHDQIGNRAFGSRLTELTDPESLRAAVALQLLSPQIPLLFMGEEWGSREPFLFFTHHGEDLAAAVRHGRSQEFAELAHFSDPEKRLQIPDPNAFETFERSIPKLSDLDHAEHRAWLDYYRKLLLLRREFIVPRLLNCTGDAAAALGSHSVRACWTLGDGAELTILLNLGNVAVGVETPPGARLFESLDGAGAAVIDGALPPRSCSVWFAPDRGRA